jgi:hypothetical protein
LVGNYSNYWFFYELKFTFFATLGFRFIIKFIIIKFLFVRTTKFEVVVGYPEYPRTSLHPFIRRGYKPGASHCPSYHPSSFVTNPKLREWHDGFVYRLAKPYQTPQE